MRRAVRLVPLALLGSLAVPHAARCQSGSRAASAVGLSLGLTGFHQRDEYLSPVTYGGTILSAALTYERRAARSLFTAEVTFAQGAINSAALPRDVIQHVGRVAVAQLGALGGADAGPRPLTVFVGGGLSSFGSITEFRATDPRSGYSYTDASWYWSHNLDLALRGEYRGRSRLFALTLTAPVVRLVSRPANGKFFNADNARVYDHWLNAMTGGRLELPWDDLALSGEAEYRQPLGHRLQLRAAYAFGCASSGRPLAMGMYMNRLLVGLLWTR